MQSNESFPPERRVLEALKKIRRARKATKPGHVLRCPAYHVFLYKDVKCTLIRCLLMDSAWVGFVRVPRKTTWSWPEDEPCPFTCGVDFEIQDGRDVLVGFHTLHVLDWNLDRPALPRTADYVSGKLCEFVDRVVFTAAEVLAPKSPFET